ncbi:MAG: hypothetical protein BroJett024_41730 [Alphaproteobacteria bacterium]|nr:MAG: hypothetical protein BroJett024_41730 [Alphaproteobacteria bacterium]
MIDALSLPFNAIDAAPNRKCRACAIPRPLTGEFFEPTESGFRHVCRECRKERHRQWAARNREHVAAKTKAWIAANRERSQQYHAEYREKNRDALQQQNKEWRARKASYIAAYRRLKRNQNPEDTAARQAANYKKHREKRRAQQKAYYSQTIEQRLARNAKRRARQIEATPPWFGDLDELAMEEAYRVSRSRGRLTGIEWHVDHIVPLRGSGVCGLHVHNNIRVIPAVVNLEKGNRYA